MGDGLFDQFFQELGATLKGTDQLPDLSKQFAELKTDQERVSYILKLDCIDDVFKLPKEVLGKSSSISTQIRSQGNKIFQARDYLQALLCYNDSVAHAPLYRGSESTDVDLSYALANRSAALFFLKSYELCIQDVELTLQTGYPEKLHYKLYDRKGKCFLKIGKSSEARVCFENAQKALEKCDLERKKKITWTNDMTKWIEKCKDEKLQENVLMLKKPEVKKAPSLDGGSHERFLSLSSACDVSYTPEKGRFIVAARDIKPGEIVLVEKPYASVVLLAKYVSHCHHCYCHYLAAIPCHQCGIARFCSDACRQEAWHSYHQTECLCLDILHNSGIGKFGHLALRTVTKSGLQFMIKYQEDLKAGLFTAASKEVEGCTPEGLYKEDDYNTIYHLVTHASDRGPNDLFRRAAMAVFILRCLEQVGFFSQVEVNVDESAAASLAELKSFVGGCLLSHLQLMPCNAHEVSELELDHSSVATSVCAEIGAGIYATLSLFNHSCDPGVTRNFCGDTCVLRTIKAIRKGEEVADNYGVVYAVQSKVERDAKLRPQYYFDCHCEACLSDWPLYPDIPSVNPKWKCDNCSEPVDDVSDLDETAEASTSEIECHKCHVKQNIKEKAQQLQQSNDKYQKAFNQLLECNVVDTLPVFIEHLSVLEKSVIKPYRDINNCQETLKQTFSLLGNCHVYQ